MAERIFITGASSGLGWELALQYAAEGVTLGLVGRRAARLEELSALCRDRGARTLVYVQDVSDGPGMVSVAEAFLEEAGGADRVIANAGIVHVEDLASGDPAPLTRVIEVNACGVLNTLVPFIPAMKAAGSGHLVAIASVAGSRPLARIATYSASKAAVRALMDGFGYELNDWGIDVTTVNPGFVVSEMTAASKTPMPFLLDTEEAAWRIRRALHARRRVFTFPARMRLLMWILARLPRFVVAWTPRSSQPAAKPSQRSLRQVDRPASDQCQYA